MPTLSRRLSEALAEAERNRTALIDHIHRVDVSAAAHDEMTSLLAKGTEWPLFIQRMADQIDGAIILCDDSLAVKGQFTSASFDGRLVDLHDGKVRAPLLAGAISQSRRSGRSVVLDAGRRTLPRHGATGRHGARRKSRHLPSGRTRSDRHSQPRAQHCRAFHRQALERETRNRSAHRVVDPAPPSHPRRSAG